MPPKFKVSREEIIEKALNVTSAKGISGLTARTLAAELGSSSKTIFGSFKNMEEVQKEVKKVAYALYKTYQSKAMADGKYPVYKASGMAYVTFAKEEKELFRLLFMCNRSGENKEDNREEIRPLLDIIMTDLGLTEEDAYIFHIEQWIYVHGIASMIATDYLDWDEKFVSRALTDVYRGLKYRYTEGRE